mmetsp:Transcript_60179/g.152593  ORF Transcript_60179/g.152593 Transcript_60179/m.152593 type:complete len:272 (-) Transcript_60179:1170-1985(-)
MPPRDEHKTQGEPPSVSSRALSRASSRRSQRGPQSPKQLDPIMYRSALPHLRSNSPLADRGICNECPPQVPSVHHQRTEDANPNVCYAACLRKPALLQRRSPHKQTAPSSCKHGEIAQCGPGSRPMKGLHPQLPHLPRRGNARPLCLACEQSWQESGAESGSASAARIPPCPQDCPRPRPCVLGAALGTKPRCDPASRRRRRRQCGSGSSGCSGWRRRRGDASALVLEVLDLLLLLRGRDRLGLGDPDVLPRAHVVDELLSTWGVGWENLQ